MFSRELTQKQDSEFYNIQNVCDIKQNYSAYEKFGKFQLAQEMAAYTCDNMLETYEININTEMTDVGIISLT